jgi:uncharacterized protein (TIGR02598 family)
MYGISKQIARAMAGHRAPFALNQCRRLRCAGFSLIEVVLAIGIMAFAFIPLLGLMPLGLNTSRQAIDTTIDAQIVQQMTSLAQQTNFSSLSILATNPLASSTPPANGLIYFDANGNMTTSANGIYKASFSAPVNTVLPGGSTTTKLATLTIYILSVHTPNGATTTDLSTNTSSKKYTVFVSDNGL